MTTTAAELAALRATFEANMAMIMGELAEARTYRTEAAARFTTLMNAEETLRHRVDRIEPVTDMVTGMRAKTAGALMLLGALGAVLWAGAAFFREKIIAALGG